MCINTELLYRLCDDLDTTVALPTKTSAPEQLSETVAMTSGERGGWPQGTLGLARVWGASLSLPPSDRPDAAVASQASHAVASCVRAMSRVDTFFSRLASSLSSSSADAVEIACVDVGHDDELGKEVEESDHYEGDAVLYQADDDDEAGVFEYVRCVRLLNSCMGVGVHDWLQLDSLGRIERMLSHSLTHRLTQTNTSKQTHELARARTNIHTYTHTHIHTYTYTRRWVWLLSEDKRASWDCWRQSNAAAAVVAAAAAAAATGWDRTLALYVGEGDDYEGDECCS